MRRVHLLISGQVQGVFLRATVRGRAQELGVTGWVRNLPDGQVEAELQGQDGDVAELIAFCRDGPGRAQVDDVVVRELPAVPGEPLFEVR